MTDTKPSENSQPERESTRNQAEEPTQSEPEPDEYHSCQSDAGEGNSNGIQWLAPPPPANFQTLEEAQTYVRDWAKSRRYAVVTAQVKRDKNEQKKAVYMICDRGRKRRSSRNEATPRKRLKTGSRKIGCPFRIALLLERSSKRWKVKISCPDHNHPATLDSVRRQNRIEALDKVEDQIQEHLLSGRSASESLAILRDELEGKVTLRDLHNRRAKIRRKLRQGQDHLSLQSVGTTEARTRRAQGQGQRGRMQRASKQQPEPTGQQVAVADAAPGQLRRRGRPKRDALGSESTTQELSGGLFMQFRINTA
ncbi:hypothetical protein VTN49DRAFT_5721 [Thermomyces lanuginosus]|uniref:uncharacterized protein n=1 Tax=Thermomyces lanuginosus TaxID=5541 RepID=UPI003742B275